MVHYVPIYPEAQGSISPGQRRRPLRSRVTAAVVQDQESIVRYLLDSPKWYNVRDRESYNLLQKTILLTRKEAFNYLQSRPDFPLDYEEIVLDTALGEISNYDKILNMFCEFVNIDARIVTIPENGRTPVHHALDNWYCRDSKLLIQKGVGLNIKNANGNILPEVALCRANGTEIFMELLIKAPFEVQEAMYLYILDENRQLEISLYSIIILAKTNPDLFFQIIKYPIEITDDDLQVSKWLCALCSMNIKILKIIVDKFSKYIRKGYLRTSFKTSFCMSEGVFSLENFDLMVESVLRPTMMALISNFNNGIIFRYFSDRTYNESFITKVYCYFLSYGLRITEIDLQYVFKQFGYCELFKIFLHLDIEMGTQTTYVKSILPIFIYDVEMDLEKFLASEGSYNGVKQLFSYFRHSRLENKHGHVAKIEQSGEPPLLTELARNAFRKFFVKKFKIQTCKTFCALLNRLPISTVHKKIIMYETKLY